jgi:hypothetical protein
MKLHCFVCASPLFPDNWERDEALHVRYLQAQVEGLSMDDVEVTVLQNGCEFPTGGLGFIRNPIPKNVAYNWLLCDANCKEEYWVFLPEDCRILPDGWIEIRKHMEKGKQCFALSKDPKAMVCRRGIFRELPQEIRTLCDMNFLGKEIACVVLRRELELRDFHSITKNWKPISEDRTRWGNELYEGMNEPDHPDINRTLGLPIFQDYGFDGWKASKDELEDVFMTIVTKSLQRQREDAEKAKSLISHYGPLITEVPYKGLLGDLKDRIGRWG